MAALIAAKAGARVILADDQNEFGGGLLESQESIDDSSPDEWVQKTVAALRESDNVTLLPRSTVFGYFDHNFLAIAEHCTDHLAATSTDVRQRLWRVRAKQVVLAQGAFERPLTFCNNDRPGVMLASAVSTYIRRYAVLPGERAVVFTNNDSAYQTAIDLAEAGATVVLVDSRAGSAGPLAQSAGEAGVAILTGHLLTDVKGTLCVKAACIARWSGEVSSTVENTIRIDCDLIATSGGWNPAVHLHSQAGGKNVWDHDRHCFVPGETAQQAVSAGAGNGDGSSRFDVPASNDR